MRTLLHRNRRRMAAGGASAAAVTAAAALAAGAPAEAHVKWFTGAEPTRLAHLPAVLTPEFLAAGLVTLVALAALTRLNVPLQRLGWVQRIHAGLDRLRPWSPWLVRIGLGLSLAAAGLSGYVLHFELVPAAPALGWLRPVQVLLGLACLWPRTDRAAAAGVAALYAWGAWEFGLHHLLDYLSFPGAAAFLWLRGRGPAIPVLYMTTGLSLAWLAIEKWTLPDMAMDILAQRGLFTFGLPPGLFIVLAGWVELAVGYLLITGVLNRFLSLTLTGLFVLTSSLFGLPELLGHWLLHAILAVFLIEGTGPYLTPVEWHRGVRLQQASVAVTLLPFVAGLMFLYYRLWPAGA